MEMPAQLSPAIWGAVCGAAAVAILGFSYGGWVTAGAAETLATQRASKAVVTALAPICVANFNRGNDAPAQLAALKNVRAWEQSAFMAKGGWAVMPGMAKVDDALATSCAALLINGKS